MIYLPKTKGLRTYPIMITANLLTLSNKSRYSTVHIILYTADGKVNVWATVPIIALIPVKKKTAPQPLFPFFKERIEKIMAETAMGRSVSPMTASRNVFITSCFLSRKLKSIISAFPPICNRYKNPPADFGRGRSLNSGKCHNFTSAFCSDSFIPIVIDKISN